MFDAGDLLHAGPRWHREIKQSQQRGTTEGRESREQTEHQQQAEDRQPPHRSQIDAADRAGGGGNRSGRELLDTQQFFRRSEQLLFESLHWPHQIAAKLLDLDPLLAEMIPIGLRLRLRILLFVEGEIVFVFVHVTDHDGRLF